MMNGKQDTIGRRNFLKIISAAGLSSVLVSAARTNAEEKPQKSKYPQVPKRELGKTKVKIPYLSFGTYQVDVDNQILLRKTLQHGVNFWDTAYNYGGGNSELGIGKFLTKNPKVRKNLFLATKASYARTPEEMEKRLVTSLKRMNTDYIDFYFGLHQCFTPAMFTDEVTED